jgi:hypothetical protein
MREVVLIYSRACDLKPKGDLMATDQHVTTVKRRLDEGIQARQTQLLTLARSPIDRERLEEIRRADAAYA